MIVLFGTGTVSAAVYLGATAGLWQIAVVWGATVTLAAYTTASISGAHLNPAVTLALVIFKALPPRTAALYIAAQFAGAAIGSLLVMLIFSTAITQHEKDKKLKRGNAEAAGSAPGCMFRSAACASNGTAAVLEGLQQATLTFVIFTVTDKKSAVPDGAAIPLIGLTVAVLISVFGPLTCAGFNPARDIAPRLVAYLFGWGDHVFKGAWAYTVGPFAGTIVGGLLHALLYP
jgi:glycerol uptake facilitator protein